MAMTVEEAAILAPGAPDTSEMPRVLRQRPDILNHPDFRGLAVDLPEGLKSFFSYNLDMIPIFKDRVRLAVMVSLAHSETKMRAITSQEIRDRTMFACAAAEALYHEGYGWAFVLDFLPVVLVKGLAHGIKAAASIDQAGKRDDGSIPQSWGVAFDEEVDVDKVAQEVQTAHEQEGSAAIDLSRTTDEEIDESFERSGEAGLAEDPDGSYLGKATRNKP